MIETIENRRIGIEKGGISLKTIQFMNNSTKRYKKLSIDNNWNMPRQLEVVRVDPNTVCEYIGENDVKNQPIYEYCWVAFPDVGEDGYETKEGFDFTNVALVVQRDGRWALTNFFSDNSSVLEDMQDQPHNQFKDIFKCCEVVGNMFDDTPEEIRQKMYGNVTIPDPEAMSEDELFDACAQASKKE